MPPYRSLRRYNRVPRGGGAVRNLARGMGYAWRHRNAIVKAGRTVGKSLKRAWTGSGSIVTQQRDVQSKRPRRSKPPNKRFARKVERVISNHAGKNTVAFLGPASGASTTAGTQNSVFFSLFGSNGAAGQNSDLFRILGLHEDVTDLEANTSKNLFFQYGVLQLQIASRSTNTTPVLVELYEYKVRKNVGVYSDPTALLNDMIAEEDVLQDPTTLLETSITLGQVGLTPFQIPNLCKNLLFGRKTTMLIDPGKTSTYTMARRKNKWMTGEKVVNSSSFALDQWTEGILLIFRGAPGNATNASASTLDFMYNRKYCWRAMDPDLKNEYMYELV